MNVVLDHYELDSQLWRSPLVEGWAGTARDGRALLIEAVEARRRPELEARVAHEFERLRRQPIVGCARPLALERVGDRVLLVFEHPGGRPLSALLDSGPVAVERLLVLARAMAKILADLDRHGLVHGSLAPHKLYVRRDDEVVLSGLGVAALPRTDEHLRATQLESVSDSLVHAAPEQLVGPGEADARSDLYALGVMLYTLACGRPPFVDGAPVELIRDHLARLPEAPRRLRPELPSALSRLIMKLLDKAPTRRYQSAAGLLADLDALGAGRVSESFVLGRRDFARAIRPPRRLYGREVQTATMRACFRHALRIEPFVVEVVGEAGLGKSATLDALGEFALAYGGRLARGHFIEGRDRPFAGLGRALDSLADQLSLEPPDKVEQLQSALVEGLGSLAGLLVEIAPRFGALLPAVAAPERVEPERARNRVRRMLVCLLEAIASREQPLILALDDVQWADAATIHALEGAALAPCRGVLVVVTLRPEALAEGGALAGSWLAAPIDRATVVRLDPLGLPALTELLADVLSREPAAVAELASTIMTHCAGNPDFALGLIHDLEHRGLLRCGREGWSWAGEVLAEAPMLASADALLTRRLRRLDAQVLELLLIGSVLGETFDVDALAHIAGSTPDAVARRIQHLIDESLLGLSGDGRLRHVHGRVRAVACAMIEPAQRRRWHRAAGRSLLSAALDPEVDDATLFRAAEHLAWGCGLWPGAEVDDPEARAALAEGDAFVAIYARAGERALAAGALATAQLHFGIAHELLGLDARTLACEPEQRALELGVVVGLAKAESVGKLGAQTRPELFAAGERRLLRLLGEPLSTVERLQVVRVRCAGLMASSRLDESVECVLDELERFGEPLPRAPGKLEVVGVLPRLLWLVRPAGVERLSALEPVEDAGVAALLDLLADVTTASYVYSPELFVLLVAKHAELLVSHGRYPTMPVVFGQVGLILANALGRRREALALSDRCLELAGDGPWRHRVAALRVFLRAWFEPLAELVPVCEGLFGAALVRGDTNTAAIVLSNEVCFAFWGGMPLREVEDRVHTRLRWVEHWGIETDAPGGELQAACCELLRLGPAPAPGQRDLFGASERSGVSLRLQLELDFDIQTALILAVFGRWAELHARGLDRLGAIDRLAPGTWWVAPGRTFAAIASAELARSSTGRTRRGHRRALARTAERMAEWAALGGDVGHWVELLEAELSVLDGDLARACTRYDAAFSAAEARANPMHAALIAERHAEALSFLGQPRLALGPLLDARERYAAWGADAKVAALDEAWPQLARLAQPPAPTARELDVSASGSGQAGPRGAGGSRVLDAASLLAASQTLAEDLRFPDVISRVMNIALDNAGAHRCVLLLAAKGRLSLAAEATPDETHAYLERPPVLAEVADRIPADLLRHVLASGEALVSEAIVDDERFAADPYFRGLIGQARDRLSVLCLPIVRQRRIIGLFYFESDSASGAFTDERLELLGLLAGHAGSALENARLYEHLRDSEIRWRSLVDQLPGYVILVRRDGGLEYVNALARPQGDDEFGFDARAFISPAVAPEIAAAVDDALAHARSARLELCVDLPGAEARWFVVRVAPIVIDGAIDRCLVVASDIHDRKQAEAARDAFEDQLRQQQRLDSIGTLASGVAHEINNPVQGIMNYAELIMSSPAADEMICEFANEIGHETQRVADIVRHLLAFARQEFVETGGEETTVQDLIQGTVALIGAILRRDQIGLSVDIPADLPQVFCRRQQIQQVVMNLVTNARDALNQRYPEYDERKQIEIWAETFVDDEDEAPWIRLCVRDGGGGVPPDVLPHIFDPFFTTKGRDQGTGLGLSVSHGIISEHAGRLGLANELGVGACFEIELPCAGPAPET